MNSLILPTLRTFLLGAIVLGVLLFLPAGTLAYWQAWVFIVVFLVSTNAIGVYLSIKDPELLERRKRAGPAAERSLAQKIIMSLAILGFLALLVFSALDHRFGWSRVSPGVSIAGDALVAVSFVVYYVVLKENRYSGSTVQTFEGQKVISTGPYALIRHPMYAGALVMTAGVALALGSWWGLAFLPLSVLVLIWRILDEEQLLKRDLPGYTEYTHTVQYRLVPHLW